MRRGLPRGAAAVAMVGCIREHITEAPVCAFHLERAQSLAAADNLVFGLRPPRIERECACACLTALCRRG